MFQTQTLFFFVASIVLSNNLECSNRAIIVHFTLHCIIVLLDTYTMILILSIIN